MKWLLTVIIVCVCIAMNACAFKKHDQKDRLVLDVSTLSLEAESKTERITALISASMKEAAADSNKTVKKEAMQTIRNIINGLGEHGYVAVDGENQINLTNAAQVIQFCDAVRAKQTASLTIIQVIGTQTQITQEHLLQGFQLYEFYTKDGSVEIDRCFYQYNPLNPDNEFTVKDTVKYHADLWQYTQDGYLLFAGSYFAEDYYIISLTDAPEYAAIRVAPLDERCRELNRR